MKRSIFVMVIFLLAFSTFAEEILELDLLIQSNNSVSLYNLRTLEGNLSSEVVSPSPYFLQIQGMDNETLHSLSFPVYFFLPDPMEEVSESLVSLRLPYSPEYAQLRVYYDEQVLYEKDLRYLCNGDSVCQEEENSISCPGDCPVGSADGWCDWEVKEPCDPDCAVCVMPEEKPMGGEKFPALPLAMGIVALILLILGVAFLFARRKKSRR